MSDEPNPMHARLDSNVLYVNPTAYWFLMIELSFDNEKTRQLAAFKAIGIDQSEIDARQGTDIELKVVHGKWDDFEQAMAQLG